MLKIARVTTLLCLFAASGCASPGEVRTVSILLGDIDGGVNNGPGSADDVHADLDWQIDVFATGLKTWPLAGFDFARKDSHVPFTFEFTLGPKEEVTEATLTLSIRGVHSKAGNDVLVLDNVSHTFNFNQLGWNPVPTSTVAERSIDLSDVAQNNLIPILQDGRLNIAIRDDTLVDYAKLELTIIANQKRRPWW